MQLSERQIGFLKEMGVRVWPKVTNSLSADCQPAQPKAVSASHRVAAGSLAGQAVAHPAAAPVAYPSEVEALDWPALRQAVNDCRACGLCVERRQALLGCGQGSAQWMIVGDAPTEEEDLAGELFVGKAGRLLDNMLRAVGLTRSESSADRTRQAYVTHGVKCRTPSSRSPAPQELASCEPFLKRQIQLVRPRLILVMGRLAAQSMLRTSEPIGKLRGRIHQYEGAPLVVTYHPAYLLRHPQDKAGAWDDLCLALEAMQGSGL